MKLYITIAALSLGLVALPLAPAQGDEFGARFTDQSPIAFLDESAHDLPAIEPAGGDTTEEKTEEKTNRTRAQKETAPAKESYSLPPFDSDR